MYRSLASLRTALPTANTFTLITGLVMLLSAGAYLYSRTTPAGYPLEAPSSPGTATEIVSGQSKNATTSVSIPFIENRGQLDARVAYYTPIAGGEVYITRDGQLVYDLHKPATRVSTQDKPRSLRGKYRPLPASGERWALTETVSGSTRTPKGIAPAATRVSSFLGKDQSRWREDLASFQQVQLDDVYPGISLTLRAYSHTVEKVFTVSPAGSPSTIRMQLDGANRISIDDSQALTVDTGLGTVTFTQPVAWQVQDGERIDVPVSWHLDEHGGYGFTVAAYDATQTLYIDPLIQSTYLGGSDEDLLTISDIAANGDLYLVGITRSTDFPGTSGGAQSTNSGGNWDAVAAILSADLTTLVQVTYLGGSDDDQPTLGHLSGTDFYILGGTTSSDFPGTTGGAQTAFGGANQTNGFPGDAFVALLSSDLTTLKQSTYFGGSDGELPGLGAFMSNGDIYIAGMTTSSDLPGRTGGAQDTYAGGTDYGDVFVALLSADLKTLQQSTYFGGSADDVGDIQITPLLEPLHSTHGIYLTGNTLSGDLPGTTGGLQAAYAGGTAAGDAFIVRLSTDLTSITQATYLGGTGDDAGLLLLDEGSSSFYFAGTTDSADFPGTAGGAQPAYGGGSFLAGFGDAAIAIVSDDLTTLTQATYLGGSGDDYLGFLYDPGAGSVYLSGSTVSTDFPGTSGGLQDTFGGGIVGGDAFISKLSSDLTTLQQSTYFGGSGDETGGASLHGNGDIYLSGLTNSTDLPGVLGGIQELPGSTGEVGDTYVARLSADLTTLHQSTYFGGSGDDLGEVLFGNDLKVYDSNGNIYLQGTTVSQDLPGVAGGAQSTYGGGVTGGDTFVALISNDLLGNPAVGPFDISGTIKNSVGTPICAIVLASGQYMFSCNPVGDFSLSGLPRRPDGSIKLQIYAHGFKPYIVYLTQSGTYNIVMTNAGTCPDYNPTYSPVVNTGSAGQWVDISGQVLVQDTSTPVCALVLASGQYMFSCGGSGDYALHIPLNANGQYKLQVYADGFAPYTIILDENKLTDTVRLAKSSECT